MQNLVNFEPKLPWIRVEAFLSSDRCPVRPLKHWKMEADVISQCRTIQALKRDANVTPQCLTSRTLNLDADAIPQCLTSRTLNCYSDATLLCWTSLSLNHSVESSNPQNLETRREPLKVDGTPSKTDHNSSQLKANPLNLTLNHQSVVILKRNNLYTNLASFHTPLPLPAKVTQ